MSTAAGSEPIVEWQGDDVKIGEVLTALNTIRKKFALAEARETEQPHPRSFVMTLVAVTSSEAEERRAQRAAKEINGQHPATAIVIRDSPGMGAGKIQAAIATDKHGSEVGGPVQCEIVTLRVRGAAGDHLAGLVAPLLPSGVPTYLWWVGTPPFGKRELGEALRICDAVVVDSARFTAPYRSFLELTELASSSHRRIGIADFQWARLEPWREAIAQFFSPSDRRPFLGGVTEIGIDYAGEGRGNRVAAALLMGWIASALGWKLRKAAGGGGGVVAASFVADNWRTVQVAFRSVGKAHLAEGAISAFRIGGSAHGETYRLSVLRDPDRQRRIAPDLGAGGFQALHAAGGEDEAGLEIAERKAAWHRDVLHERADNLHHTATGDAPGESVPPRPRVFIRERRRADTSLVLLTLIDIGDASTLRHVQRIEPDDETALLLKLLSYGAHDRVYARSLVSAAELMRSI
jgi:glucose-6-phosphate dehydrogenase assembly protein OpcA